MAKKKDNESKSPLQKSIDKEKAAIAKKYTLKLKHVTHPIKSTKLAKKSVQDQTVQAIKDGSLKQYSPDEGMKMLNSQFHQGVRKMPRWKLILLILFIAFVMVILVFGIFGKDI